MAFHRKQSPRQVLRAFRKRPQEVQVRRAGMENADRGYRQNPGSDGGRTVMSVFKVISGGLRALVHRQQNERELDEELRAYVEDAAEQKVRSGMTRENAWRQARAEMGSLEGVKENVREVGWEAVLQSFVQDVR